MHTCLLARAGIVITTLSIGSLPGMTRPRVLVSSYLVYRQAGSSCTLGAYIHSQATPLSYKLKMIMYKTSFDL